MLPFYHPFRISKQGKPCATRSLYPKIEGLGLYVVYIVYHVVRIKKNINMLHNRIEIEIESNCKEYELLHP